MILGKTVYPLEISVSVSLVGDNTCALCIYVEIDIDISHKDINDQYPYISII